MKRKESISRKFIKWIIKRFIILIDKNNDLLVLSIKVDEHKDYTIIVDRYFDDYWTHGVNKYYYDEKDKE